LNFQNAALAYIILKMLTTKFTDFDAYKLGIIDENGKQLKKPTTPVEEAAWTILTRIVVRVKRAVQKSGGAATLASLAATYWLVRECYNTKHLPTESIISENFLELVACSEKYLPVEEIIIVESFIPEDAPTNNTTGIAGEHSPVITPKRAKRYREFNVSPEVMSRFSNGKKKFRKWADYLDMTNEDEAELYNYARSNPRSIIVLKNGDSIRAIRFNRYGAGNWHKIKRTPAAGITESHRAVIIQSCNPTEF
jgi:hypothetical protein